MKTKHLLLFLAGLILTLISHTINLEAQDNPPDSCLKYPIGTDEFPYFNPDSVKIDSCGYSLTFGQWYTTKFKLQFKRWVYIFKTRPFIIDSLYSWENIDSNHMEMKGIFSDLTFLFGEYHFKRHPLEVNDSDFIKVPTLLLIFDNYIHGETLINYVSSSFPPDSIYYIHINRVPVLLSIIEPNKNNKEYTITITDNDKLNIKRNVFDGQSINVFIYDLMGNLITKHIEKNDNDIIQIDISSLQSGFYFVMIDNKYVYKLMHFD